MRYNVHVFMLCRPLASQLKTHSVRVSGSKMAALLGDVTQPFPSVSTSEPGKFRYVIRRLVWIKCFYLVLMVVVILFFLKILEKNNFFLTGALSKSRWTGSLESNAFYIGFWLFVQCFQEKKCWNKYLSVFSICHNFFMGWLYQERCNNVIVHQNVVCQGR